MSSVSLWLNEFADMLDDINRISSEFDDALASANTAAALDELRVHYFGRKGGLIPALFSRLKEVPKEQKKDAGDALNKLRDRLESELKEKHERIAAAEAKRKEARDIIDVARWRPSSARWATHSIPAPRLRPIGTTSKRSTSHPIIRPAIRRTHSSSTRFSTANPTCCAPTLRTCRSVRWRITSRP